MKSSFLAVSLLLPLAVGCGGQKVKLNDHRIQEKLDSGDRQDADGFFYDSYWFEALESGNATVQFESEFFNPYLFVYDDSGSLLEEDDDGGYNDDAKATVRVTFGRRYRIVCTSKNPSEVGDYRLKTSNNLQFHSTINRGEPSGR